MTATVILALLSVFVFGFFLGTKRGKPKAENKVITPKKQAETSKSETSNFLNYDGTKQE